MSASDYLENELLDHILGEGSRNYTPTTLYVGLYTASTGLESNAPTSEVTGGGYTRLNVSFGAASGGTATNNAIAQFPPATTAWGNVTHMAILDAASGGNVIFWSTLNSAKNIQVDDIFQFSVGTIQVSLD